MQIGYAQTVITPSLDRPVFLAGFGSNRRAQSVHDDLYARALAISDGKAALVLCALDLIGFFRPDVYAVVESLTDQEVYRSLRPEIVIACTHTHHGPDTMGLWGPDQKTRGVDEAWMPVLKERIRSAILAALENLQPCAAYRFASVRVPGVARNARDPHIVDDELAVAQFFSPEGKALAALFNFPCHPEVLWDQNPSITSDYPASLREEVEKQSGAPCIFFSGALGGMMTPDVTDHSFAESEAMGRTIAEAGLAALAAAEPIPAGAGQPIKLSLQKKVFAAKLTNPLYKIAFWRKLLPDARDKKGCITSEVNLIKIGGLWLASVPGEMLPKLGLALKDDLRRSGAQVAGVIGLANDELGYILPLEDFKYPLNPFSPGDHYEETNSIGKDITPKVMEGVRSLLPAETARESSG
jgi:hypothetical protein